MKSFDETNWKWDFPKWKSDFWHIENQDVANAVLKNDWKSPKNDWKGWFWASILEGQEVNIPSAAIRQKSSRRRSRHCRPG